MCKMLRKKCQLRDDQISNNQLVEDNRKNCCINLNLEAFFLHVRNYGEK